ncbi:MAG: metallophosphoesterase [Planctomycetes bacterium]|nr:metallophosphoesterase [Planctomycetota bacterium]MCB9886320.1 metallophosphoesterase [Planctomycetota bacterium]
MRPPTAPRSDLSRRGFLTLGAGAVLLPLAGCAATRAARTEPLRIGLIADLHHGLDPRAQERIEDFVAAAQRRRADMIVQLGDFNYAEPANRPCMQAFDAFAGERHHVLGNHDLDKFGKEHVLDFWQMRARYYSFDRGGWHFVVLDRNHVRQGDVYVPYAKGNYFSAEGNLSHADPEQLEWLAADLRSTRAPTVVFVHQGVGMSNDAYPDDDSRAPIEATLAAANRDGAQVVACFCGHEHLDRHNHKDGVHYVWVNSASYYWVGAKYGRMAPYADALYAFVDLRDDCLVLHGRQSQFVSPTPQERGYPQWQEVSAAQQDRRLPVPRA